jgi:exodeoxyribonuclease X-like protein
MVDGEEGNEKAFEVEEDRLRPVGPGTSSSFDPTRLDFGHYAGRTIEELAAADPDYLRWLEKHPSGVRYRAEIRRVTGTISTSIDWSR